MKTQNEIEEIANNQNELSDKLKKNNRNQNIENKEINNKNNTKEDPDFDINTFCPDPFPTKKKVRSRTVRESVKKGKLKQLMEEEKNNKLDAKKLLRTPQVMVPRLRPQKPSLNPTPLKLNRFSLKPSKLNLIKEENLSEREEESENSENSESPSSSSSFLSDESEEKEQKEEDEIVNEDIIEEKDEEKEEEEKKEENNNEEIKEDNNKQSIGILGCLIKEKNNKEKEIENEEKEKDKIDENNLFENKINEEKNEENDILSLKERRKNMRKDKKSFHIKKKDVFSIIDLNIKNNYKKFKEDVLDEEKNNDEIILNNENNTTKCCPILDFYIKRSTIVKAKI